MEYDHFYVLSIPLKDIRRGAAQRAQVAAAQNAQIQESEPDMPFDILAAFPSNADVLFRKQVAEVVRINLERLLNAGGSQTEGFQKVARIRYPKRLPGKAVTSDWAMTSVRCITDSTPVRVVVRCSLDYVDLCADLPARRCGFLWMSKRAPMLLKAKVYKQLSEAVPVISAAIENVGQEVPTRLESQSVANLNRASHGRAEVTPSAAREIDFPVVHASERPKMAVKYCSAAWHALEQGQYEKAWSGFNLAQKYNRDDYQVWKGKGAVCVRLKLWVVGAKWFSKAVELNGADAYSRFYHAQCIDMAGRNERYACDLYMVFLKHSEHSADLDIVPLIALARQRVKEMG